VHILYNLVNTMASGSGDSFRHNWSNVWQHFKKEGSKNVICTLCNSKFVYHGGTSNLRDHLQRSHFAVYAHDSGQPKIDSLMKVQKCSPAQGNILDNLMVGLTVHDLRPTRMIEGLGFQELMEYYEILYHHGNISVSLCLIGIAVEKHY